MKLYLQDLVDRIDYNNIPIEWRTYDLISFSEKMRLYPYQQNALVNTQKALYKYFYESNGDDTKSLKDKFNKLYIDNGLEDNLDVDINLVKNKKYKEAYSEYEDDYPIRKKGKKEFLDFKYFINRMSYWMATGSGKTLVIVKLIGLLFELMKTRQIPKKNILFLAHRDDLIEQFRDHVVEYNRFNTSRTINLFELKEYDQIKKSTQDVFVQNQQAINIFYYRSDLLNEETKEKIINYRNYDNDGNWYIILDEAHKGDSEDSKRKRIYSIMSRNGFLFNFSATFTDETDYATCVYNFNLQKFIAEGYGKHIYISGKAVEGFKDNQDFSEFEKQKVVLKSLFLLSYIKKYSLKIKNIDSLLYHKPMLLTLVNSVNTEDSDLLLFFREINKIAKGEVSEDIISSAKQDVIDELTESPKYIFEEDKEVGFNEEEFRQLSIDDVLQYVFNSTSIGNIEVIKIPKRNQELIFKLTTSDNPFAMIKIGDISDWLKSKLDGYEIIEAWQDDSYFEKLNDTNSDINILMGSRAFYEGWDSNRPNIILFVNIGVGTNSRKFVLQSVGRGVRIEPIKNQRRRLQFLKANDKINQERFDNLKDDAKELENLYVFGTNAKNLIEIIKTMEDEKQEVEIGSYFDINPEMTGKDLLIPVYKESAKYLSDRAKFAISENDFEILERYWDKNPDTVITSKFLLRPYILDKVKRSFQNVNEFYTDYTRSINNHEILLNNLIRHFSLRYREFDKFKSIDDEIIHFKKIKVKDKEKADSIVERVEKIKKYTEKKEKESEIIKDYANDPEVLIKKIRNLDFIYPEETYYKQLRIKYLYNHYYIPIVLSDSERIQYINHIINVQSEVRFINALEQYFQQKNNKFKEYDWWFFSKIDETTDKVYIPYYDIKDNIIKKYFPDFVFWLNKGDEYKLLFVDPKGTAFSDYQHKIDYYKKIYEENNIPKKLSYKDYSIEVLLKLYTQNDKKEVGEKYRKYWADSIEGLL